MAVLLVGVPFITKLTRGTDAKEVEVQTVELKLIKSSILASGTLAYREQVQLRSEVIGQVTDIFTAAYPDTPLTGTVQSIASVARKEQGQASLFFLVKILLDEQDTMVIRPGMSVRADIYTQSSEETLAVPVQAVRKAVKTGISSDSDQEIVAGLEQGEVVIAGPFRILRSLQDGDAVEEKEPEEKKEGENTVSVEVE